MMQQGDYNSAPYHPYPPYQNPNPNPNPNTNPNPNPTDLYQSSFASAPPYSSGYLSSDYPTNYHPYPQNSDPVPTPPVAPLYNNTQSSSPSLPPFNPTSQSTAFPSFESHSPSYRPPAQQPQHQTYYPPFDQPQTPSGYVPPPPVSSIPSHSNPSSNPIPNSSYSSLYSAPYSQPGASVPPTYDNPYENSVKYDHGSAYFDDRYGNFNRSRSDLGSDSYGKSYELGRDDGFEDGVYAYNGGKVEPYGARGTASKSSSSAMFDDYGRSISVPSEKDSSVSSSKIVKAVPKADTQQDMMSGVQKFRVKLLAESYGQTTMDVLCQIALDGIRMLDPSTNRTLRIYSLESITRCEVMDSTILAFWSKSSVDIEPRRIRLQSNSYTTNTLLDTVTAATVQLKEMGGVRSKPSEPLKMNEQSTERKKGIADWVNMIKPGNEEKDHWVPDEAVSKCLSCGTDFGAFVRKHHCRNCGDIFCVKCTQGRISLTADENAPAVRVCDKCMAEVTQRLSNTKESANKPAGFQSHEDLARKLQEEMEKNRKSSTGLKSDGSGRRMKEVACPICTVHLQVQVPSSGSETIECGVCQHPFLVNSH